MKAVVTVLCVFMVAGVPATLSVCADICAMLQPDIIVAERGDMVTLVCSTNIVGKTFPRGWVINGTENDLSQGASFYEVNGLNISFEQMFTTRIKFQCYFLSQTEKVYSNNATLVPEIESIRVSRDEYNIVPVCHEENVTFSNSVNESNMHVGIEQKNSDCELSVNLSSCADLNNDIVEGLVTSYNEYYVTIEIQPVDGLYGNDVTAQINDICDDCREMFYIPDMTPTVYKFIAGNYTGFIIDDLSNEYGCDFGALLIDYTICIHSRGSTDCYATPCGNGHIYTTFCNQTNPSDGRVSLQVSGVQNGTVVSIFCLGNDCRGSFSNVMLFNIGIILTCDSCDENAECIEGQCVCKEKYAGDGTNCERQIVSLLRTQPNPQQLPCPHQRIEFQCQILDPSYVLAWTLPDGSFLEFAGGSDIGENLIANSSDIIYTATLTNKIKDPNSNIKFLFTSNLSVVESVNGSNLTCEGGIGEDPVNVSTTVTHSGTPDPPHNLAYNDGVLIETSVCIQWTRPSYAGGVPLAYYTVSVDGQTQTLEDDSDIVEYSTGLVYGEVLVSTINTCGQESQPATINIPAAAPPQLSNTVVNFDCDDNDFPSSRIMWMYGVLEQGIVYPGDVEVVVELTNGSNICPDVTIADNNCSVTLPRDVYNISISQSNGIGSTVYITMFDTRILIVNWELFGQDLLEVEVEVNGGCPQTEYFIVVIFGTMNSSKICEGQQNITKGPLFPGETVFVLIKTNSIYIEPGEEYCYNLGILHERVGIPDHDESSSLLFVTTVPVVPLTVIIILVCAYILKRKKGNLQLERHLSGDTDVHVEHFSKTEQKETSP